MRIYSTQLRAVLICLVALFVSQSSHAATQIITIPTAQLDRYQLIKKQEKMESFYMDRTYLSGPEIIGIEVPPDYRIDTKSRNSSVALIHQRMRATRADFYSFTEQAFGYKLSDNALNLYLEQKQQAQPPEANFKILERAETTTGRAKFRILGRRALTIRYEITVSEQPFIIAENWVELNGRIYVVSITGSEDYFDSIYKQLRVSLNSMHLAEDQ